MLVQGSISNGRFAQNRQGQWSFVERTWVEDSLPDGTARFNVAPLPGATTVVLQFESDGALSRRLEVPVGLPT